MKVFASDYVAVNGENQPLRASPMSSCTCNCIREPKVGSIRDTEVDAGKSANHAGIPSLNLLHLS